MIQIFVLLSFFSWIISLVGMGSFLHIFITKYFKDFELMTEIKLLYYGTLGLILISVIGTIFNFFIPLGQLFSTTIFIIGIVLFYVYKKNILTFSSNLDLSMLGVLSLFCGLFSLMNLTNYDTGLYHLPVINWITKSALPYGLANLHDRFGFNSLWLIDASIVYPLRTITNSPFFIINAILYFFYGTFIFLTFSKIIKEAKANFSSLFALSTFLPYAYLLKTLITSPSPDTPTMLFSFFITFLVIKSFETKKYDHLFIALIIAFFTLTIKLSAFPYFIEILLILIALLVAKKITPIKCAITSLILFLMAIPYLIRGLISSGYIAFPSTLGRFNLKWSIAPESAIISANEIKSWARKRNTDWSELSGNWNWLGSWITKNNDFLKLWLGLVLLGIILIILCFILKKKKNAIAFFITSLLALSSCLFWFFSAPAPRFGYGYLFSLTGILLSYGLRNLLANKKLNTPLLKITLALFFFLLIFQNNLSLKQLLNTKKFKDAKYIENTLTKSTIIYSPKRGDQCFDAPLPCAPTFNPNLKIVFDKNNKPIMFYFEK